MNTHVVCLDGTGQIRTQTSPTNIALIFDALGGTVVDGGKASWESTLVVAGVPVQTAKYLPGVGSEGPAILQRLEQSVGAGIAEQIVRGYTYLSRLYKRGDEIVIIGFSRGAAAARCLAGFVVVEGLLNPVKYDPANKDAAYLRAISAWYRYRADQPHLARDPALTDVCTLGELPTLQDEDFVAIERIKAVAVFDTVSSVGVPHLEADGWLGYDFVIADTELHSKVLNGFHALSADENRANFLPTFWTPRANITQVIFPGVHSDVGGGYPETSLSDCALAWMLTKLVGQGLRIDKTLIRDIQPEPNGVGHNDAGDWPWNVLPKAPRVFPIDTFGGEQAFVIDQSLRQRWGEEVTVVPGDLAAPYASVGVFFGPKQLYQPSSK